MLRRLRAVRLQSLRLIWGVARTALPADLVRLLAVLYLVGATQLLVIALLLPADPITAYRGSDGLTPSHTPWGHLLAGEVPFIRFGPVVAACVIVLCGVVFRSAATAVVAARVNTPAAGQAARRARRLLAARRIGRPRAWRTRASTLRSATARLLVTAGVAGGVIAVVPGVLDLQTGSTIADFGIFALTCAGILIVAAAGGALAGVVTGGRPGGAWLARPIAPNAGRPLTAARKPTRRAGVRRIATRSRWRLAALTTWAIVATACMVLLTQPPGCVSDAEIRRWVDRSGAPLFTPAQIAAGAAIDADVRRISKDPGTIGAEHEDWLRAVKPGEMPAAGRPLPPLPQVPAPTSGIVAVLPEEVGDLVTAHEKWADSLRSDPPANARAVVAFVRVSEQVEGRYPFRARFVSDVVGRFIETNRFAIIRGHHRPLLRDIDAALWRLQQQTDRPVADALYLLGIGLQRHSVRHGRTGMEGLAPLGAEPPHRLVPLAMFDTVTVERDDLATGARRYVAAWPLGDRPARAIIRALEALEPYRDMSAREALRWAAGMPVTPAPRLGPDASPGFMEPPAVAVMQRVAVNTAFGHAEIRRARLLLRLAGIDTRELAPAPGGPPLVVGADDLPFVDDWAVHTLDLRDPFSEDGAEPISVSIAPDGDVRVFSRLRPDPAPHGEYSRLPGLLPPGERRYGP
jgi:hypothetical protein